MKKNFVQKIVFATISLTFLHSANAATYTFTDLAMTPYDINDSGQIVGQASNSFSSYPAIYSNGTYTGAGPSGVVLPIPKGINNTGQIVGIDQGHGWSKGFIYNYINSTQTMLEGNNMGAAGINDSGQVVGGYTALNAQWNYENRGFVYNNGVYTDIIAPNAFSTSATDINNLGQIVGSYSDDSGTHGFLLSGDNFTTIDFPAAAQTMVYGINDSGQMVGTFAVLDGFQYGPMQGFVFDGSAFSVFSYPNAQSGSTTFLGGINNAGQIVGYSNYYDGYQNHTYGFLATPEVPLPSALWLFGSGMLGLIGANRKKSDLAIQVLG